MKKILLISLALCLATFSQAKTVSISAGGLYAALTATELDTVTTLTITGTIDARDFKTMRNNMTSLRVINMSGATIAAYTGTGGTASTSSTTYAVNTIPSYAFYDGSNDLGKRSITSIILPASLIAIGSYAFEDCRSLKTLNIPAAVNSIGIHAFDNCRSLTSITLPTAITVIDDYLFYECYSLASITVPTGVLSIEYGAFKYCSSLTTVNLPNTLTLIDNSFSNCNKLANITLPSSLSSLGSGAFESCTSLASINIPTGITSIAYNTFSSCTSLSTITIPANLTSISATAFLNCTSLSFTVDAANPSYSSLGGVLFNKTKSILVNCPASLTGSYTIPSTVFTIGDYAFFNCDKITAISLPSTLTNIGDYAFYNCDLITMVNIPSSVTSIGDDAFEYCTKLTKVTIPSSVTSIGRYAFNSSTLSSVSVSNPVPCGVGAFGFYTSSPATLYVPTGAKSAYQAAVVWKDFSHIIEGNGFWLSTYAMSLYNMDGVYYSPINVYANVSWTAVSSNPEWLTIGPSSGSNDGVITLTTVLNGATTSRTATITVSSQGLPNQVVTITQAGSSGGPTSDELAVVQEPALVLYPNPVVESFRIRGFEGVGKLILSDLSGRTVLAQSITAEEAVAVDNLAAGMYVVTLSLEGKNIQLKFVKK